MTKYKILFLFFLFVILLIPFSLSASLTLINSHALNHNVGWGGISIINNGQGALMFGRFNDLNPNFVSEYVFGSANNISTLNWVQDVNLSVLYPQPFENYTLSVAYITDNNQNVYLVAQNQTTGSQIKFVILHYTWTNSVIGNWTFSDMTNLTLRNTVYSPALDGIWTNGNLLLLSGAWTTPGLGLENRPFRLAFNISSSPYNVNMLNFPYTNLTSSYSTSFPFNYTEAGYPAFSSNAYIWLSPDNSFFMEITGDFRTGGTGGTFHMPITQSNYSLQYVNPPAGVLGIGVSYYYGTPYIWTSTSGALKQYIIENYTSNLTVSSTAGQNTLIESLVNPLINLFPDRNDISFSQALGIVFIIMLLTAGIILFAGSSITNGVPTLLLYIIALIEVFEFFFFVSISYVPLSWIIIIGIVTILFLYLRFRGGSGG